MKKILFIFLILFANFLNAQVCFSPFATYPAGSTPNSIISEDFDNDGKKDLAVSNQTLNTVSILLGTGTGSFGIATSFTVGNTPRSLTSSDFNEDGNMDLAVAMGGLNKVAILLGTGTGSFVSSYSFAVGTNPYSIISVDFNMDGNMDIATCNYGSANISVLLGQGTGSFNIASNYAGNTQPISITSGDFDGDGLLDIATADFGYSSVSFYFGTSPGVFTGGWYYSIFPSVPYSISSADYNGDGEPDVVVSMKNPNQIRVIYNITSSMSSIYDYTVSSVPGAITSGDFNGDLQTDFAVANYSVNNVSVVTGTGMGNIYFSGGIFPTDLTPSAITTADFNGDGKKDLAVTNYSTSNISVLLNTAPPYVTINNTYSQICPGSTITLVASGANTYSWSTGASTSSINVAPNITATYSVTGTTFGCSANADALVDVVPPETPSICMVTTDSLGINNIIYWDKTNYSNVDSFFVYRDTANNDFALIGKVHRDSLSLFVDTARSIGAVNGDPNIGTYRYKIALKDTCGRLSSLSPYHNTVYIIDLGNGLFTYNHYAIEFQATPVPGLSQYVLKRDNANNGIWTTASTIGAASTLINDPQYNTYQSIANWRLETNWSKVCVATMKYGINGVFASAVKSRSNVRNNRLIGVKENELDKQGIVLYPNPVYNQLTISSLKTLKEIQVITLTGEIINTIAPLSNKTAIDLSNFSSGIYIIKMQQSNGSNYYSKVVKQ